MSHQVPGAWHPDPFRRFEYRYWDGYQWTSYVASRGQQTVDTPVVHPAARGVQGAPFQTPALAYRPALFTEPILIIDQAVKRKGANVGYALRDQHGRQIGSVEEDRGFWKRRRDKRHHSNGSRAYELQVMGIDGQVAFRLIRPMSWTPKSKVKVTTSTGRPIGEIAQETFGLKGDVATAAHALLSGVFTSAVEGWDKVGHVRFRMEAAGRVVGSIHGTNTDRSEFVVRDVSETEIAVITKRWTGWLQERFTNADSYAVRIDRPLQEPLRTLVIAAALAVDLGLKQSTPTTFGRLGDVRRSST